ncbi:hypothetical protein M0805_000534 [Coniferiporia weirii]|nr:hypothetical protein M0805_000534 [Coniferiporia weirii]
MPPDFDVYAHQLFSLNHGYGLYEPDPGGQYDRVRVGDVGYVLYGGFQRLFNIFADEDDPVNHLGVPENFEPLPSASRATFRRTPLMPGAMCAIVPVVQAGASIELACSKQQGAALVIKHPAYREDSSRRRALSRYMLQHYPTWLTFARSNLDQDIRLKDLLLVTGCDLTADWATAAFTDSSQENSISFQVGFSGFASAQARFWGEWSSSTRVRHRCGPQPLMPPAVLDAGSRSDVFHADPLSEFNQCIFVRAFRVHERPYFLPNVIKGSADPKDLGGSRDLDAPPSMSGTVDNAQDGLGREDNDVYNAVFDYIMRNSEADIALVHDDDICALMAEAEGRGTEDIQLFLQSRQPEIEQEIFDGPLSSLSKVFRLGKLESDSEEGSPSLMQRPSADWSGSSSAHSNSGQCHDRNSAIRAEIIPCHKEPVILSVLNKIRPQIATRSISRKDEKLSGTSRHERSDSDDGFSLKFWRRCRSSRTDAPPARSSDKFVAGKKGEDVGLKPRRVANEPHPPRYICPPPYDFPDTWGTIGQIPYNRL